MALLIRAIACVVVLLIGSTEAHGSHQRLKVVFAGFGRSGTNSLAVALKRLGYQTCQSQNILKNIVCCHSGLAQAIIDHNVDAIIEETEELGYNATLEAHSHFWKEIMKRRPDAKYIFTVRDTDQFMESANAAYWFLMPMVRYPFRFFPMFERSTQMTAAIFGYALESESVGWEHLKNPFDPIQQDNLRQAYEKYREEALAITKTQNNTLLLDLRDGYSALCPFLDIEVADCPSEPYPHLFSNNFMMIMGWVFRVIEVLLVCGPFLVVWGLWRFNRGGAATKEKKT